MRSVFSFALSLAVAALPAIAIAAPPAPAKAAAALPLRGSISFVGSKVTGSHTGDFKDWKGSLTLKNGKAEGGKLEFTVQMATFVCDADSRNAYTEKLEGHLKSPDFFDVAKFPTASFVSDAIKAGGADGNTHTVSGNLTIRGVTKRVTFGAAIADKGSEVNGKTAFSINRKDFGIVYAGKADDLIRDGVVLKIDVTATK